MLKCCSHNAHSLYYIQLTELVNRPERLKSFLSLSLRFNNPNTSLISQNKRKWQNDIVVSIKLKSHVTRQAWSRDDEWLINIIDGLLSYFHNQLRIFINSFDLSSNVNCTRVSARSSIIITLFCHQSTGWTFSFAKLPETRMDGLEKWKQNTQKAST